MPIIEIQDLHPTGYDLLADEESYLKELSSDEEISVEGGYSPAFASSGVCVVSLTVAAVTYVSIVAYRRIVEP